MPILLLVSVTALALILERFFFLGRMNTGGVNFIDQIKTILGLTPTQDRIDAAVALCIKAKEKNPLAAVLSVLLSKNSMSLAGLERLAENEKNKRLPDLERRLTAISTIASVAPLLGLLGTVLGMIKSFVVISGGNVESSALAAGISEALLTTAAGLTIAIPCLISYNYFLRRIESILHDIEIANGEIIDIIKNDEI